MLSFSPYAHISQVSPQAALECVFYVMHRWGHIKCFRFDNGLPFGDPKRMRRTPCVLNLIARDCQVIINPPRTPTKNAKVERCQGTTGRWSDAKSCENLEEFRQTLQYAVVAQRERLKTRVCEGMNRITYYPQLKTNIRKYNSQDFDSLRVFKYLEKGRWTRLISISGQIRIFSKRYHIGNQFKGLEITIKCKVIENQPYWLCYDEQQVLIKTILAVNIADETYFNII